MFAIFTETADGRLNFAMEFAGELVDTGHIPAVKEHIEDVLVGLADNGVEVRFEKPANPYPRYLVHHYLPAGYQVSGSGRLFPINEGC